MKYLSAVVFFLLFSSFSFSKDTAFPDDIHAMPLADSMEGYEWSYRQGMDFDVLGFQNSQGNGVKIYMGVDASVLQSHFTGDFVSAKLLNQEVKLYKKCNIDSECNYTTLIDAGTEAGLNNLWAQIWVIPENGQLKPYLNWLSSLQFVSAKL